MEQREKEELADYYRRTRAAPNGQPYPYFQHSNGYRHTNEERAGASSSHRPDPFPTPLQRARSNATEISSSNTTAFADWPETGSIASSHPPVVQQSVQRKPVQRRTISEGSPADRSPANQWRQSQLSVRSTNTTTSVLLSRASGSLNSLTETIREPTVRNSTEERPPPYVAHPSPPPSNGDVKRPEVFNANPQEPRSVFATIRDNRPDAMRRMLERGINIDDIDPPTKRTVLMEAVHLRRNQCAQLLLEAGCRVHLKDSEGNTALHLAAAHGDVEMCRQILLADAQVDEYNHLGETPTQLAARGGHTDSVLCLLNSWTLQRATGSSLLAGYMEATKSGNVRTAEAFVERGIQPPKVKEQWRVVANAAESGSIPMIDFLLIHKVDLKQRSPEGWTALHFAAALGHTAMVEKLLTWKLPWKAQTKKTLETALHLAILRFHPSTAMALILHQDSKVTMPDADGQQAIHHATRNGDAGLVSTLLNRGLLTNKTVKVDERNSYGWTPMLIASAYGHLHLVAEFITRGANLEEKLDFPAFRPSRKTNAAAQKGYWAEIRWPHSGARPLHLALEFGHDEVATTLIAAGAKIDESDSAGWKPLHYAAFSGRSQMVELLVSKGASPHSTTSDGNTALSLGFREFGLTAPYEEREQIYNFLQMAMHARKKSKFKQFTSFMGAGGSSKSKEVSDRNRIWHTAGLAEALYQSGQLVVDDEDEVEIGAEENGGLLTPTTSVRPSLDDRYDEETLPATPATARTSRRWTKSMTD